MMISRKYIFIGLFCCMLALGFSGMAMAAEESEAPLTDVVLTDYDRDVIDLIRQSRAGDWQQFTRRNSGITYDALDDMYIVNERYMYIIKERINTSLPLNETKVTSGKTEIGILDFMQQVNNLDGRSMALKEVTYWKHKNGTMVATKIVIR